MFLGANPCWIKKSSFFLQAFYLHARFPRNLCLLWDTNAACFAAQKTQISFLNLSLLKYSLLPFFLSKHSNSKLSPNHPSNASLSHCSSALYLAGLHAPRDTHLPGRLWCLAPSCSKRFPKTTRPSSSLPWPHNTSCTKKVTCVVGDAGGKPSTSVLTLLRLLITGLTVLLTADSLLCLL